MSSVTDTTSRIGETLLLLQKLEALLQAGLILALKDSESDERLRLLLRRDRETMGMLLRHMKDRVELPHEFADTLDELLAKRNILVHGLCLQDWFDLKTLEGRNRVNDFISELLSNASVAVRILIGYAEARTINEVPDMAHAERNAFDRIIRRIFVTAAPDFGEKTPDEYLKNFTESVRTGYVRRIRQKT